MLPTENPYNLIWLNLSYNYLVKIEDEILNFPLLRTLNLNGNYISDLEEVRKLGNLSELRNLTLNSNPFEEIEGYRMYVIGLMFAKYETLRKLDNVYITTAEHDSAIVWNEHLYKENKNKLKKLRPKIQKDEYGMVNKTKQKEPWAPRHPPSKEEDENTKTGGTG